MFRVLIVGEQNEQVRKLTSALGQRGFTCSNACDGEKAIEQVAGRALDVVLVAVNGSPAGSGMSHLAQRIKQERNMPVIALLSREALGSIDSGLGMDDFAVEPWDATEVAARAKRTLRQANSRDRGGLIECGNLVIDLGRCEVSLSGRRVSLTFKEYELLRFLAGNKGRVFSREALLNKVWGYEYYGGDRTVDVHIRRIRGKIEERDCPFIETVRNIGYRFKENA